MAQWSRPDAANSSVLWAPALFNKTANTTTRDAMYQNTTPNAFVAGETVGQYSIGSSDITSTTIRVNAVTVADAGSNGYAIGDKLAPTGTGSPNAEFTVTAVTIVSAAVDAGGTGYANGDLVGDTSTGTVFEVTTGAADTIVSSISIVDGGVWYNTIPANFNPVTLTGTGANLALDTIVTGVSALSITNAGSYANTPTASNNALTSTTGNGSGAKVNLTLGAKPSETTAAGGTGWAVRREGSGGRAGRVQYELLVAMGQSHDE